MLRRAWRLGVKAVWVAADTVSGNDGTFRRLLDPPVRITPDAGSARGGVCKGHRSRAGREQPQGRRTAPPSDRGGRFRHLRIPPHRPRPVEGDLPGERALPPPAPMAGATPTPVPHSTGRSGLPPAVALHVYSRATPAR